MSNNIISELQKRCRTSRHLDFKNGMTSFRLFDNVLQSDEEIDLNGQKRHVQTIQVTSGSHYEIGWVIDREANSCMICSGLFTLFNRRHHCRKCGWLICKNCAKFKVPVNCLNERGGSVVCPKCVDVMNAATLNNCAEVLAPLDVSPNAEHLTEGEVSDHCRSSISLSLMSAPSSPRHTSGAEITTARASACTSPSISISPPRASADHALSLENTSSNISNDDTNNNNDIMNNNNNITNNNPNSTPTDRSNTTTATITTVIDIDTDHVEAAREAQPGTTQEVLDDAATSCSGTDTDTQSVSSFTSLQRMLLKSASFSTTTSSVTGTGSSRKKHKIVSISALKRRFSALNVFAHSSPDLATSAEIAGAAEDSVKGDNDDGDNATSSSHVGDDKGAMLSRRKTDSHLLRTQTNQQPQLQTHAQQNSVSLAPTPEFVIKTKRRPELGTGNITTVTSTVTAPPVVKKAVKNTDNDNDNDSAKLFINVMSHPLVAMFVSSAARASAVPAVRRPSAHNKVANNSMSIAPSKAAVAGPDMTALELLLDHLDILCGTEKSSLDKAGLPCRTVDVVVSASVMLAISQAGASDEDTENGQVTAQCQLTLAILKHLNTHYYNHRLDTIQFKLPAIKRKYVGFEEPLTVNVIAQ